MIGFTRLESAIVLKRPPITNLKSWTHWGHIGDTLWETKISSTMTGPLQYMLEC